MKFLNFFLFLWVIFALLDLDPDSQSRSTDLIESRSNPLHSGNNASHQGLTTSQCRQSPFAYEFLPQFTINEYLSINFNSIFLTNLSINLPNQLSSTIFLSTCLIQYLNQPSSTIHQSTILNDPSIKVPS